LAGEYWVHTGSAAVDEGRIAVTGEEADRYVFRVASLRNVAETAPYFHDGSVADLEKAIQVMTEAQIGLQLPEEEAADIAAFLRSLTGEVPPEAMSSAGG
jgi:cytochrome c peroxidase